MEIEYRLNEKLHPDEFRGLLNRCSLGARRPVDHPDVMQGMVENTNLMVTAWDGELLVGVSRSVTDFHYACYLSDLAVDEAYQSRGIGKRMMQMTADQLGPQCSLILLAAPAANDYYPHVGFENNPRCWVLPPGKAIS